jgi:hypothetical protein
MAGFGCRECQDLTVELDLDVVTGRARARAMGRLSSATAPAHREVDMGTLAPHAQRRD